MMFRCGLCSKTKMGKYNLLRYVALNDDGIPTDYNMKVCKPCSVTLAGSGKLDKTQFAKNAEGNPGDIGGRGTKD